MYQSPLVRNRNPLQKRVPNQLKGSQKMREELLSVSSQCIKVLNVLSLEFELLKVNNYHRYQLEMKRQKRK